MFYGKVNQSVFDVIHSLCVFMHSYFMVFPGCLTTLKHLKDDVAMVKTGMECGLSIDNEDFEFRPGDQIICYSESETKQNISWDPGF